MGTRGYGQGDPRKQDLRWPGVRVMQGGTSFPAQAGVLCTLVEIKFKGRGSLLKSPRPPFLSLTRTLSLTVSGYHQTLFRPACKAHQPELGMTSRPASHERQAIGDLVNVDLFVRNHGCPPHQPPYWSLTRDILRMRTATVHRDGQSGNQTHAALFSGRIRHCYAMEA